MGTQNHEAPGYLRLVEMLETKAVGQVREAHIITDRPGKWWPQGVNAPTGKHDIPAHLDWDLWLGPAKARPYNPPMLHLNGVDSGTSAVGPSETWQSI